MSFLITHIDVHESLDEDIQFKIENALGIWTSKEHEIWDDVEKYMYPYTVKSLEYESNRPHALTSFMQSS